MRFAGEYCCGVCVRASLVLWVGDRGLELASAEAYRLGITERCFRSG